MRRPVGIFGALDPQNTYRNFSLESFFLGARMRDVNRNFVFGSLGAFDPQNTYRNFSLESLFLAAGMRIVYRNFVFRVRHAHCDSQNTYRNCCLESLCDTAHVNCI